jgi:hypothetical protein
LVRSVDQEAGSWSLPSCTPLKLRYSLPGSGKASSEHFQGPGQHQVSTFARIRPRCRFVWPWTIIRGVEAVLPRCAPLALACASHRAFSPPHADRRRRSISFVVCVEPGPAGGGSRHLRMRSADTVALTGSDDPTPSGPLVQSGPLGLLLCPAYCWPEMSLTRCTRSDLRPDLSVARLWASTSFGCRGSLSGVEGRPDSSPRSRKRRS